MDTRIKFRTADKPILTIDSKEYPLTLVTPSEMLEHRMSKIPGAAYKNGDKLYYAKLDINTISHIPSGCLGSHLCGRNCVNVGTCPRTSSLTVNFQSRTMNKRHPYDILCSWRIEKPEMSIVEEGLEFFNMKTDVFHVMQCSAYEARQPAPVLSKKEAKEAAARTAGHKMYLFSTFTGIDINSPKGMIAELRRMGLPSKYDKHNRNY